LEGVLQTEESRMRVIKSEQDPFPVPTPSQPFCAHLADLALEVGRLGRDFHDVPFAGSLRGIINAADSDPAEPIRDLKWKLVRAHESRPKAATSDEIEWSPNQAAVQINVDVTNQGNLRVMFDLMDEAAQYVLYRTAKAEWGGILPKVSSLVLLSTISTLLVNTHVIRCAR
jgi:hypothetical protein